MPHMQPGKQASWTFCGFVSVLSKNTIKINQRKEQRYKCSRKGGWSYKTSYVRKVSLIWWPSRRRVAGDEEHFRKESGPILLKYSFGSSCVTLQQGAWQQEWARGKRINSACFLGRCCINECRVWKAWVVTWEPKSTNSKQWWLWERCTLTETWLSIAAFEHSDRFVSSIIYGKLIQ